MSHGQAALERSRVAVVSTSLDPVANELWMAAREHVGELVVFGARRKGEPEVVGAQSLREIDGGRGLIYRHLVGLRRSLRQFRPDLVHVNGETWALTVQELLSQSPPLVVHGAENRWDHGRGLEQALRRRLVRRAVQKMAGYASWNHDGADHVQELARAAGRHVSTLVLPAIIPPPMFRGAHWDPPALHDEAPVEILLVGQVIEKKGFADVITACARLARPARVTLCGRGDLEGPLSVEAARLGVPLRVSGLVTPTELAALMSRSHLLVQPSRTIADWSEQFGRSVAEAMTVGLPCLVSDSGELPVLVGHDSSAVFPEGDVAALTMRLQALLEVPTRLAELSRRQSELARPYEPSQAGSALATFWAGLLA